MKTVPSDFLKLQGKYLRKTDKDRGFVLFVLFCSELNLKGEKISLPSHLHTHTEPRVPPVNGAVLICVLIAGCSTT